jgi:chromosomal replication initiator protein
MSRNLDQYLKDTWNRVLEYLLNNRKIENQIIDNFFRPCSLYELTEEKAIISAPNVVAKQIVQSQAELIGTAFQDVMEIQHPILVELYQQAELKTREKLQENSIQINPGNFAGAPLQADKTFDNFVVGDCNRESHAAALACAYDPGKFFNPLFIYSNPGMGKTHLLMAIGNYVLKVTPTKKVYYTDSLKFVETVVNAIRDNQIEAFKQYMYGIDLLLIDDIQFLAGKEKSHEIFFTIFNELVNNHKQICIASDRQPQEIKGLEERLISRFNSGLSVGIDSPEFETSLAILKMKIKSSGYAMSSMDDKALAYIASNCSKDVRNLEGALNRVLFYAIEFQPQGDTIEYETVMNALKNQTVVSDKSGLSPKKIIKCTADYYNLPRQTITSKSRTKNIANARHIAIYLCRKLLDISYIKIGEEFGGRDHSTIISACTKVEKQIKKDPMFAKAINEIEALTKA